jgi:acyl-CoA thioester hydrolase
MQGENGFSIDIEVRFRDIDALGHVNNAVFLTYLEESRKNFMRRIYHTSHPFGAGFIMARIACDYLRPIRLEDHIRVILGVRKIGRKSFTLHYRIVDRSDENIRFAEAESVQVCYDYRENRSVPVSDDFREKLSRFLEHPENTPPTAVWKGKNDHADL